MKLGIIIPAKNEEKELPYLLASIKEQTFKNFKIIIADADSTDRTKEIAKKYGCLIAEGGMPSIGRNRGAKEAIKLHSDILVFIDADVVLPSKDFLEKAVNEFKKRKLDIAGTLQQPLDSASKINKKNVTGTCKRSEVWKYNAFYEVSNFFINKSEKNKKNAFMQNCMFAKPKVHNAIHGFQLLEFGEDSRYSTDAVRKKFKFGILKQPEKIFISPRRFEKKGFAKMVFIYLFFNIGRLLGYEFRSNKTKMKYFDE